MGAVVPRIRPARGGLWEYVFFADIEGHRSDPNVARALVELSARASLLKVLGSYPMAPVEIETESVRRRS